MKTKCTNDIVKNMHLIQQQMARKWNIDISFMQAVLKNPRLMLSLLKNSVAAKLTKKHSYLQKQLQKTCTCNSDLKSSKSNYHDLTSGTSTARRDRPERRLNGRAAHNSAMPLAVLSVYRGVSVMNGCTKSGSSNSSSSSGNGSTP